MSATYDELPYSDFPIAQTHPDVLYAAARKAGLDTAAPSHCRLLEIGCAHGVNLIPLAFRMPSAQFIGIDLSAVQITEARRRAAELELNNLELRVADVATLDPADFDQKFDYIVVHGLFSWVPHPVRISLLERLEQLLAPNGVAYVSYNAMPAWGVRAGVVQALRAVTEGIDDPALQIRSARQTLAELGSMQGLDGTAEGALISAEVTGLTDKPDSYLMHEYLAPHQQAFYVREFVQMAGEAKLEYVGDVAELPLPAEAVAQMRQVFADSHDSQIVVEQLLDLAIFRVFRATLLTHAGSTRTHGLEIELDALRPDGPGVHTDGLLAVSRLTRLEARELGFLSTPANHYAPADAFHRAVLARLDGGSDRAGVLDRLVDAFESGELQLGAGEVVPPREELVTALAPMLDTVLRNLRSVELLTQPE